jgi:myo-inositol catabolism protein IolS
MEYLKLKYTDLIVSRWGFGCAALGGFGWGIVNETDLFESVYTAMDLGVNFFDTADIYGLGKSEENLGKLLYGKRNQFIIASKFGVRRNNNMTYYDNSAKYLDSALEHSLKRLKTDYIDIYQLHYWDEKTPLEVIFEKLERFKEQGKIRYYGVTNLQFENFPNPCPENLITYSLEFSLANRQSETQILAIKEQTSKSFLAWGSLGQGILTGKYTLESTYQANDRRQTLAFKNFHGSELTRNLNIVGLINDIQTNYFNKSSSQIALRWIMDYLGFGVILVGSKSKAQSISNAGAFGWCLSEEDIHLLDKYSNLSLIDNL